MPGMGIPNPRSAWPTRAARVLGPLGMSQTTYWAWPQAATPLPALSTRGPDGAATRRAPLRPGPEP